MKLGELCLLFTDGDWIESKDQSDSGIRLIQTGNIGNGEFLYKNDKVNYYFDFTIRKSVNANKLGYFTYKKKWDG